MLGKLLAVYAVYLAAAMSPGPAVIYVMRTAVGSRPLGLRAALGVATATTGWVVLVAVGLGAALKHSPLADAAIRGGGGLYFVYLAWKLAQSAAQPGPAALGEARTPAPASGWSAYAEGVITNAANPKAALFFTALLGLYDVPAMPVAARTAVYCGIPALSVCWYSSLSVAFSNARVSRAYLGLRRPLDGSLAAVFLVLGVKLVQSAAHL